MAKRLTKADLAECEAHEAALLAVLAWPSVPEPPAYSAEKIKELATGLYGGEVVRAWTFNEYTGRVTHGCFNSVHHNTDGAKTRSQTQGGPWYGTHEDAEIALWWATCRKCAAELLKVARINLEAGRLAIKDA